MPENESDSGREVEVGTSRWRVTVGTDASFSEREGAPPVAAPAASATIEIISWTPGGTRITLPAPPEAWSHSNVVAFLVGELESLRDCFE